MIAGLQQRTGSVHAPLSDAAINSSELSALVREDTELLNQAMAWLRDQVPVTCQAANEVTVLLTGRCLTLHDLVLTVDRCHWLPGDLLAGGVIPHLTKVSHHLPN
jgi:hypothetical protein